jgi:hypothetical protein
MITEPITMRMDPGSRIVPVATRDLSPAQVERLRAAVKAVWAEGTYPTKTAMAGAARVFQAQISNLINDAPIGIAFPTAEKIARNLLKKDVRAVIGEANAPPPKKEEIDYAIEMATKGEVPLEAIQSVVRSVGRSATHDRWEWLALFRGAGIRELGERKRKQRKAAAEVVEEPAPRVKRKVVGDDD